MRTDALGRPVVPMPATVRYDDLFDALEAAIFAASRGQVSGDDYQRLLAMVREIERKLGNGQGLEPLAY